jgi:hypothetical protein
MAAQQPGESDRDYRPLPLATGEGLQWRCFRPTPLAIDLPSSLSRLMSYAADDRLRAFNDRILLIEALRLGLTVLTRNIGDFDLLAEMVPAGGVLFYRRRGVR